MSLAKKQKLNKILIIAEAGVNHNGNLEIAKKMVDKASQAGANYIKFQLKSIKITNIDMIKIDTFEKRNNFFSARRSLRSKHDDYGRNISIIMLN